MSKLFALALLVLVTSTFGASLASLDEMELSLLLDGRIVGGYNVDIVQHPHQVSLRRKSCATCAYTHTCGGSIYNENVIVTAAHCVNGRYAENFTIVAGTNKRNGGDGVVARVAKIVMHEKYDNARTDNDVALMFLALSLPLNGITIASVPLASNVPEGGSKATISGWGTTSSGGYSSDQLLAVDVPIVGNKRCDEAYSVYYGNSRITDSMLCAGVDGVGGKDACQGDSGGPLLVNRELAGIVSWGLGCALADFPGVYANVAHLRPWILATIKDNE